MNFKPAVETLVILMSQNREMFLLDHNPASVNNPTMSRTMNLLWAQISISRSVVRVQRVIPITKSAAATVESETEVALRGCGYFRGRTQSTLCVLKIPKMFHR